jgi:FkbM family methyltransferase
MYGRNASDRRGGDSDSAAAAGWGTVAFVMSLSLQYDEAKLVADYFARHPRVGTMIDVGAHTGTSFRNYLRQGWRVYAYEPDSTKLAALQPHLANPNLTFARVAVADVPRDAMQFYTSPESTGIASLVPFRTSHVPSETVPVVALRDEVRRHGIASIDFLKIDTEGFDLHVLRGHDWDVSPEVILTEFDEVKTRPQGFDHHAIGELLISHGYAVYCSQWAPLVRYGSGHAWHSIRHYPCDLHHPDAWGNFVAVRADAHLDAIEQLVAPHL